MDTIIFGTTALSQMMRYYFEKYTDHRVVAFCEDAQYKGAESFDNLPNLDFENIEKQFSKEQFQILLTCGYKGMAELRKKKYLTCKEKGYRIASFIHPAALIETENIGEGNLIFENVMILPFTTIGNCNIFFPSTMISHHNRIGDYNTFSGSTTSGQVEVGSHCYVANRAVIKDQVKIADYSLIGAHSYVNKNTKEYGVYPASPSKRIKSLTSLEIEI